MKCDSVAFVRPAGPTRRKTDEVRGDSAETGALGNGAASNPIEAAAARPAVVGIVLRVDAGLPAARRAFGTRASRVHHRHSVGATKFAVPRWSLMHSWHERIDHADEIDVLPAVAEPSR